MENKVKKSTIYIYNIIFSSLFAIILGCGLILLRLSETIGQFYFGAGCTIVSVALLIYIMIYSNKLLEE
jgi:hypothetical protein